MPMVAPKVMSILYCSCSESVTIADASRKGHGWPFICPQRQASGSELVGAFVLSSYFLLGSMDAFYHLVQYCLFSSFLDVEPAFLPQMTLRIETDRTPASSVGTEFPEAVKGGICLPTKRFHPFETADLVWDSSSSGLCKQGGFGKQILVFGGIAFRHLLTGKQEAPLFQPLVVQLN